MKYYLFQKNGNTIIFIDDLNKPDRIFPYKALSHNRNYSSIEKYFKTIEEYWVSGLDINELLTYNDFKMKSDSLDEIIECATLEAL